MILLGKGSEPQVSLAPKRNSVVFPNRDNKLEAHHQWRGLLAKFPFDPLFPALRLALGLIARIR